MTSRSRLAGYDAIWPKGRGWSLWTCVCVCSCHISGCGDPRESSFRGRVSPDCWIRSLLNHGGDQHQQPRCGSTLTLALGNLWLTHQLHRSFHENIFFGKWQIERVLFFSKLSSLCYEKLQERVPNILSCFPDGVSAPSGRWNHSEGSVPSFLRNVSLQFGVFFTIYSFSVRNLLLYFEMSPGRLRGLIHTSSVQLCWRWVQGYPPAAFSFSTFSHICCTSMGESEILLAGQLWKSV